MVHGSGGQSIASITTGGVITQYPAPFSSPTGITEGPGGGLWYVGGDLIGQAIFPTASVSFKPATGITGAQVTLSGNGFAPNENVSLYADNASVVLAGSIHADASGGFSLGETVGAIPNIAITR